MRYWGAVGMLIHMEAARREVNSLAQASRDPSSAVAVMAAEALYGLGETEAAVEAYQRILRDASYDMLDRNFALNSIDGAQVSHPVLTQVIKDFYEANQEGKEGFARYGAYDWLMSEFLLKKWNSLP
jgi:hypothetical protein